MPGPAVGASSLPAAVSRSPRATATGAAAAAVLGLLAAGGVAAAATALVTTRADLLLAAMVLLAAAVLVPGLATVAGNGASALAWVDAGKRTLDLVLASLALVALLPFLALVALAVKLGDGGPVFFRQSRVGMNGELFSMYKFRSMRPSDEAPAPGVIVKLRDDERITPVGRILRRTSLDELPQLANILIGDMSIVGPRPLPPGEAAVVPDWAAARWQVRPGLTCYWQVGGRSEIGWDERMEMDVRYVEERSLGVDVLLIARTFDAVVSGRGAY
jgi:lipopolysaccharide/colanic/teichoic acid biosynthesis glycosyltransferase